MLLNYIYVCFPSVINKFSYSQHQGKQHGIDLTAIPSNTTLVIAPDSSSNEYDIHKSLREKGLDIVVLDHHEAERVSEYACVVNNQLCDYPTKSLSGVGVVYKLCQYIDNMLPEGSYANSFLDLVTVGLVGDMMDQRDMETHHLTQVGLDHFSNPFISAMAEKNAYSLGNEITPIGVAFYIVPLINAVTRVGTMEEKTLLFESMLEWKAYEEIPSTKRGCKGQMETRVEQSVRTCGNVKNRQTKAQDVAVEIVEQLIESRNLNDYKVLLIKVDNPTFDKSITGLIANKIMAKYQKPTCLVTETEPGYWSGSARAPGQCELTNFRVFCEESGLVELAQGHPSAFGFGIYESRIKEFLNYAENAFKDITFSPIYKVDYIFSAQENFAKTILELGDAKKLWGQEVSEPLIVIENLAVTKDMITLMARDRNPTLKIQLPNGVACIKFKSSDEELQSLYSENGCVNINLVGRSEVNRYYNSVTPQLLVMDYEIINRQEYYF